MQLELNKKTFQDGECKLLKTSIIKQPVNLPTQVFDWICIFCFGYLELSNVNMSDINAFPTPRIICDILTPSEIPLFSGIIKKSESENV